MLEVGLCTVFETKIEYIFLEETFSTDKTLAPLIT